MKAVALPIGIGTIAADSNSRADNTPAYLVNCYVEREKSYRSIPGMRTIFSDLTDPITGIYESRLLGIVLFTCGTNLYRLTNATTGAYTLIKSDVVSRTLPTAWAESGTEVYLAGNSTITATNGTTAATITNSPRNVTSLAFMGGYLLADGDPSIGSAVPGDINYSDNISGGVWEVFNNEQNPDGIQSIISLWGELYAIGTETVEVSFIDGTTPFAVNKSATQAVGAVSKYTVAFNRESLVFLTNINGNYKFVELQNGRTPTEISADIALDLSKFERLDDARAYMLPIRSETLYVCTFPNANCTIDDHNYSSVTLAYHYNSKKWIILGEYQTDLDWFTAFKGYIACHSTIFNKTLVGNIETGTMYYIDDNYHLVDGKAIQSRIRTGHISYGDVTSRKFAGEYHYNVKRGFGDLVENVEYSILHRWSDDYRRDWSPWREIPLGRVGDYLGIIRTTRCGSYNVREHEIAFTAESDFLVNGIVEYLEIK